MNRNGAHPSLPLLGAARMVLPGPQEQYGLARSLLLGITTLSPRPLDDDGNSPMGGHDADDMDAEAEAAFDVSASNTPPPQTQPTHPPPAPDTPVGSTLHPVPLPVITSRSKPWIYRTWRAWAPHSL